jgi:HEPN domain-containing protein
MDVKATIEPRFKRLIEEGREMLRAVGWDGRHFSSHHPPDDAYFRFRTEALNLVRRACGEQSDHYRELKRLAESKDSANNSFYLPPCVGVVEAAHRDFAAGALFDMRALIVAEVLGDFMEQAEALLAAGYWHPAASLAGAILEDTLRKLCTKHGIAVPESTKIDRLNAELAKAGVYDKLIQKRITALADIRNNADHGHFDKFSRDDVDDMVKWLRRFTADNLA